MNILKKTGKSYGFLWSKNPDVAVEKWHFSAMQEIIREPIVSGVMGIDVGCGCGYDTFIMAKNNPGVKLVSVDISDGVYDAARISRKLNNVRPIKCSILDMPLKENIFDFAYSFGVLHHTTSPKKCLLEINRILKKNKPVFLYLYEDHKDDPLKYIAVKIIALIRSYTVMLPPKIIFILSWLFSPFVFMLFTLPAKILNNFKSTQKLSSKIPFNFGRGIFSLQGDLYDRFSAPIECRFGRQELYDMFVECGFSVVNITKLNGIAGWVVWGHKL
jgi:ubiquinone/menaquinone biosynthesis C-methylase UbiE